MGTRHSLHRLKPLILSREMKPGRYADGGGLGLVVYRDGSRSWYFRFMVRGQSREMGLGSFQAVPLTEARKMAADCRLLKSQGVDPIEVRRSKWQAAEQAKAEAERAGVTFRQCAEAYIEAYRHSWTNDKHAAQWTSSLETYAYRKPAEWIGMGRPLLDGLRHTRECGQGFQHRKPALRCQRHGTFH
jgi:hypothetical protein